MKKKLILIGTVCLLLLSCYTSKPTIIYDDSTPVKETAWIFIGGINRCSITGYNGIPVNWPEEEMVQIPAGDTLLEWKFTGAYRGENIMFQYNFLPQKKYYFEVDRKDGKHGLIVYIFDFEESPYSLGRPSQKNVAGFVPFLGTGEKRVLK